MVHAYILVQTEVGRAAAVAQEIARRSWYRVASHRLELFGTCPDCLALAQA